MNSINQEEIKICPKCQTEISKKATICPSCKSDLRNWFVKHYILTTILIIFLLNSLFQLNWSKNTSSQITADTHSDLQKSDITNVEKVYKIKENVPVGGFSYSINSVEAFDSIKWSYTSTKANWIFKLMSISVVNTDKEPKTLDNSMFKVLDWSWNTYSYSSEWDMAYALKNWGKLNFFLKQMQPNLPVSGFLIFDLPKDAKWLKLEVTWGYWSSDKAVISID